MPHLKSAFVLVALVVTGCLSFSTAPVEVEVSVGVPTVTPPARRGAPTNLSEMGCFFVDINGPGVVPTQRPPSAFPKLNACLGLGKTSSLVTLDALRSGVTVKTVAGRQRTVRVIGVVPQRGGSCATGGAITDLFTPGAQPALYEVASTQTALYRGSRVALSAPYQPSKATNLVDRCATSLPLALTAVSPTSGPAAGGTLLTLTGTGFVPGMRVTLGGQDCTQMSYGSAFQVTCVTPPHAAGAVDVAAIAPNATTSIMVGAFSYGGLLVSSVSPSSGSTSGGTTLTITGAGFSTASITVGGASCPVVGSPTSTQLQCTTSGRPAGLVDVVVTNVDSTTGTLRNAFTYGSLNSWNGMGSTSLTDRTEHTAVAAGNKMVVWGGYKGSLTFDDGGVYDATTNTWGTVQTSGRPPARRTHTAVFTGDTGDPTTSNRMIIWGGYDSSFINYLNSGGSYDVVADSWSSVSDTLQTPSARSQHTAVWTGSRMIVWGGRDGSNELNDGGNYDPATNSWATVTTTSAPARRARQTAVWTGSRMVVWGGGQGANVLNTGGRYDPANDTWQSTTTTDAADARQAHTAVWTGSRMLVWGGDQAGSYSFISKGASYDPVNDVWTAMSDTGEPQARHRHTAVWNGTHMIVWGGQGTGASVPVRSLDTGGVYHPATNSWASNGTSTVSAPTARHNHTAVWVYGSMIVWAGEGQSTTYGDGARYTP